MKSVKQVEELQERQQLQGLWAFWRASNWLLNQQRTKNSSKSFLFSNRKSKSEICGRAGFDSTFIEYLLAKHLKEFLKCLENIQNCSSSSRVIYQPLHLAPMLTFLHPLPSNLATSITPINFQLARKVKLLIWSRNQLKILKSFTNHSSTMLSLSFKK